MLIDAVSNVTSPGFNAYIAWVASSQHINPYLGARVDLFIAKGIRRKLFYEGISQKLERTGIATSAMQEHKIQLLDLNGVYRR